MKKIQIFNLLLLLMLLVPSKMLAMYPCQNKVIPMHKEKGHLRARTEEPSIVANLQQGMLIVSVSRYFGKTAVYIYDDNGCLVTSMSTFVDGKELYSFDLSIMEKGAYNVVIELGDSIYVGAFEL